MGGKPALQGLTFHLPVGSMTYLTGHSGAGKSTLLKLIMGVERANGGQIWFNGHDITRLTHYEIPFFAPPDWNGTSGLSPVAGSLSGGQCSITINYYWHAS